MIPDAPNHYAQWIADNPPPADDPAQRLVRIHYSFVPDGLSCSFDGDVWGSLRTAPLNTTPGRWGNNARLVRGFSRFDGRGRTDWELGWHFCMEYVFIAASIYDSLREAFRARARASGRPT